MVKKPVIIVSPQRMPMEEPFRNWYHYSSCFHSESILAAGGMPLIPPFLGQEDGLELLEQADGLYLTGGADLDPALYGQKAIPSCGSLEPERDQSDLNLLRAALQLHKPVLAVCRGFQLVNIFFGGTLYQDVPSQYKTNVKHSRYDTYSQCTAHAVTIVEGTPLHRLTGRKTMMVNSLHHQAVSTLSSSLEPMAYAPDGLVESFWLPGDTQWLRGYQWHPEMLPEHRMLFSQFISACKK